MTTEISWLLSVDPGTNSAGWALWHLDGDLIELKSWGRLHNAHHASQHDELLMSLLPAWDRAHVVVENQWYREPTWKNGQKVYHSAPFNRVQRIIEDRVRWTAAAEILGATTELADPGKWIPNMTHGAPGETPDDRIKWACSKRWPSVELVDDENPAVLLGTWWAERPERRLRVR